MGDRLSVQERRTWLVLHAVMSGVLSRPSVQLFHAARITRSTTGPHLPPRPWLGRHEEAPRTGHWAPGGKRAEPGNGRQDEERRSEAVSWLSADR